MSNWGGVEHQPVMECHQGSERCWRELKVIFMETNNQHSRGKGFVQFLVEGSKIKMIPIFVDPMFQMF